MPLYEYQCDACRHRFERIQKFSDPPVEVCPKCGGRVSKLVSSPAFQFKGSGWYVTDYARKPEAAKSDDGPAKDGKAPPAKETTGEAAKDASKDSTKDSAKESTKEPAKTPVSNP
jgi:putative FmdB family regulatory protein